MPGAELKSHTDRGPAARGRRLRPAFADPEFLLRRDARHPLPSSSCSARPGPDRPGHREHRGGVRQRASRPRAKPRSARRALALRAHTGRRNAGRPPAAQRPLLRSGAAVRAPRGHVQHRIGWLPSACSSPRAAGRASWKPNRARIEVGQPTVGLNIALPHEQQANPLRDAGAELQVPLRCARCTS